MSAAPEPKVDAPAPKSTAKHVSIPQLLVVLLLLAGIYIWLRGTWAAAIPKDTVSPNAGCVTQLLQSANGNIVVRCSMVVDAPPKDVWAVVKDCDKYEEFLPYLNDLSVKKIADGQRFVQGTAHSGVLGDWPFESVVTHKESPYDDEYSLVWSDEGRGSFKFNRGSWSLTPADKAHQQTRLVCVAHIEAKDYPNFLVRNVIMNRLPAIVQAMRDESLRRRKE